MIRRSEVINYTRELTSSLTSSSGLIYWNELEILVPIEFAEMFAIFFFNITLETAITRSHYNSGYFGDKIPEEDIIIPVFPI